MGKRYSWWPWGFGRREQVQHGAELVRDVSVDTALIIEAARHVVTTRVATGPSLERHLYVTPETSLQLLARLVHCEVLAPATAGRPHRVMATSEELPRIIAEFQRRG